MLSILTAVLLAAPVAGPAPDLAALELRDQYGTTDNLAAHRGEVVVAFVVTARRLRNIKPWEEALRERHAGLAFVRVADVPDERPASHDEVAAKLRKRVPEDVPVLIDLERAWATALDLDTQRPNVLVFDPRGRLAASVRGLLEPALVDEISGAIADLRDGP